MAIKIIKPLAFLMLMIVLLLAVNSLAEAYNGDFSLSLNMNGEDISDLETVVIDPEQELTIDNNDYTNTS